jgi:hypothetical protein
MSARLPEPRAAMAAAGSPTRTLPWALRPLVTATLALLLAQYLVGMMVNLYVQIPAAHPGTQGASPYSEDLPQTVQGLDWALGHGALTLRLHVVLGLLLGLLGLAVLGVAIAARRRAWIVVAVVGLLAIVGAGVNGVAFMNAQEQAINSLAMAFDFLLAVVAYSIGLYVTH